MRIPRVLVFVGCIACASSASRMASGGDPVRPLLTLGTTEASVTAAAVSSVLLLLPADTAAACVLLSGPPPASWYSPDAGLLAMVQSPSRRVVPPAACPTTYESMAVFVPSPEHPQAPVRPHGYVDPHRITVVERPTVGGDSALVIIHSGQGTSNRSYHCMARRAPRDRWLAECHETQTWTSTLSPNVALQLTIAFR